MEINIANLQGPALNWAVRFAISGVKPKDYVENRDNFSTCWNKGGPLIFQFGIATRQTSDGNWYAMRSQDLGYDEGAQWKTFTIQAAANGKARRANMSMRQQRFEANDPLVAAMRAIVAYKIGDTVDVPDHLVGLSLAPSLA